MEKTRILLSHVSLSASFRHPSKFVSCERSTDLAATAEGTLIRNAYRSVIAMIHGSLLLSVHYNTAPFNVCRIKNSKDGWHGWG